MSYIGIPPYGQTVRSLSSHTATAGQTTFYPTGGYTVSYLDVYLNGLRMVSGTDYTASDGLSVVFTDPLVLDDVVEIVVYGTISFADSVRRSGDTLTGTYYTQDLIPSANVTYNIGSANARYNDIYLSNSSIYIGDIVISANATNLIIANTTGGALAISNTSLPNTGVTAGSYGNSSAIPVITVDATGRVTSATTNAVAGVTGFTYTAANATFTISTGAGSTYLATIAANSITTGMLTDSGVTAGAYGNTTAIPVITVDAKGRVTAMSTSSVSGVTGTAWTAANNTLTVATSTTNYTANLNSWQAPVTFSNTVNAGNTTVTGYANVSTTLQVTGATTLANTIAVTGNATFSNTLAVTGTSTFTGLITGTITSANNADYLDGYHAAAFAQLAGAAFTGPVSGVTTLAAGNTTITGFANVTGNTTVGGTINANDVIVSGNLTVSGTTTYINTTNLNVGDNLITLNADLGAVAPTEDAGIIVNRGSAANVQFNWDETNDRWALGNTYVTGTITSTSAASIGSTLAAGNTTITGFANVSTTLQVTGAATFANTLNVTGLITGTVTSANNADYLDGQHGAYYAANSQLANYLPLAGGTMTGAVLTTAGANAIVLSNTTSNYITWNNNGVAAPTATTRSAGTKLVLYGGMSATSVDYALGIESSTMWQSVPDPTASFKWYANTTNIMTANTTGLNMNTRAINGVTTLATGNTTITGFANVTGSIQGGSTLTIAGAASGITTLAAGNTTITGFANITSTIQVGGAVTLAGAITSTAGANAIVLSNATSNYIAWNTNGVGAPTTTTRSSGTKLVLYPISDVARVDYAVGIESNHMWFSADNTTSGFKWYSNTTNIMTANTTGLNLNSRALSGVTTGTFAGAVSGITTLAAGNTTITGFANVSSTLQVGGVSTLSNTTIYNATANATLTIWPANGNSDAIMRFVGQDGNIATEGAELHYYNAVGDVELKQTWTGITGTTPAIRFSTANYANAMIVAGGGNVGVGNTAPAHKLSVNGNIYAGVPFIENATAITANYTVAANTNAMSAGPITIADGVTVTVSDGSTWTVV